MSEIGICIKNRNKEVVYQNKSCKNICGDKQNQICKINCMAYYQNFERTKKTQYFSNSQIENKPYDILFIEDDDSLTTLLIPVSEQHQKDLRYLKKFDLTRSEMDIALLVCQGKSNKEICSHLHISRSTLKTHLNHIYRKIDRDFLTSRRAN